jgi:hypothetical protein
VRPAQERRRHVIEEKAKILKGFVDAVNITDNQTAVVRVCSMASGYPGPAERPRGDHADDLPRP